MLDEDSLLDAVSILGARDRTLAAIIGRVGPPPLWHRPPGWRTLLRIILEQQVSLASARASYNRLRRGVQPFSARNLARQDPAALRALGITRQKGRYSIALGRAVQERRFDAARLSRCDDETVCAALCALDGVGHWTAQCYLLFALRRPDVWPDGDLALRNAVQTHYGIRAEGRRLRLVDNWRPWRSVAARLMWHDYLSRD